MKKLNVPNMLTILRVILVPVFVAFVMYDFIASPWKELVCALLFTVTALTDMLDGNIARKYNLITNFGKFMDALADKFMVYSAYIVISVKTADPLMSRLLIWLTVIIILRDLVINGIRMIASGSGTVIAAQLSGKLKTLTQSVSVVVILMEPFLAHFLKWGFLRAGVLSYIAIGATLIATLWSGFDYVKSYSKFIDFN